MLANLSRQVTLNADSIYWGVPTLKAINEIQQKAAVLPGAGKVVLHPRIVQYEQRLPIGLARRMECDVQILRPDFFEEHRLPETVLAAMRHYSLVDDVP